MNSLQNWTVENWWKILVMLAAIPFAVFVWPTRYHYEHTPSMPQEDPQVLLIRIDRFSGQIDRLYALGHWRPTNGQ
jgi:hypothetical protein